MSMDFDVVIAGGGLNGPALGLALADAGLSVAVIDSAPARARAGDNFDGRAYALALSSVRLLGALGLWPELEPDAQPIRRVLTHQSAGEGAGPFGLHFDSAEMEEPSFGHMLEDRFLYRALLEAMGQRLTHIPATSVIAQTPGPAAIEVALSDGRTLRARLLVGADGRASSVAQRAGIGRTGHDYGQTALVAAIAQERPHNGTAWQVFLPSGPIGVLPLKDGRASVVWSAKTPLAEAIASLSDSDFIAALTPHLEAATGRIELAGPRFSYPLSLTLANDYIAERIALIGDAAHGVHPVAGQGLNLGLRDVASLAECVIDAHRRGEDIGMAPTLARYQGWRRFDSTSLAMGMDAVNTLFSNDNPALRLLREAGMGAVSAIGPLRRRFMRQAAGLTLDPMPRLLTGEKL
ncbi:MAG: UbiH/UbiF/VisC/COQ6 family ubiquinone biosynthesis hydroxylase [Paracoccus sp. (in: a-proteobacteria)]|nr:UbiH/UbiF/VisC/COQ6 family ubiquinone biosynthesis hydroxylase [Paracoccus sp. (in: a-proteobacteria)]